MASEYSVNIKLNTAQVKRDLKTIGDGIGNLGKKQARGSKSALSDAEKQLKLENTALALKNRGLGLSLKALPLQLKGVKLDEAALKIQQATTDAEKFEFDLAKNSLLLADKDIKKAQIRFKAQNDINKATLKTVKVEDTVNKQLRERTKTLGQIVKLRNLGSSAGRLAGRFEFEEALNTRAPGGGMLALPSAEMLDQRVRGSGQAGGFSRNIPRFRLPRPTRGFDVGSALISGGFPLLFGQGPIGALAGGLGGGIGGMFGQMGGFAGGIAATAIVQQVQNTIAAVSKLGQAFNLLTPDVEGLTVALGASGTEREKQIQLIKKTEGTQAALAAVTEQLNQQIGEKGVKNLKEFGETTRLIGNAFQLLGTKMLAALAPVLKLLAAPITAEAARAETNRLANVGGAATDPTLLDLQTQLENVRGGRSGQKQADRIRAQIEARKEELAIVGKGIERQRTVNLIEDSRLKKIRQQNELLQAKINGNHEEVLLAQELDAKIKEMLEDGMTEQEIDRKKIKDLLTQNNLLEKQAQQAEKIKQQFASLGQSLATDVADGLQGLIRGTSTLNDLLNNVLNKLIDAAFNMALFGNPGGTLGGGGLFGSLFGGLGSIFGGGGLPSSQVLGQRASAMTGIPMNLPAGSFANGGNPPVGRASLIGERGPELFVPNRAGTIIPNHALGGTTNVVVNVDASGSNVEGDEEEGRELGRLISVAIQSELIKQKRPGGMLA